MSIEAYEAVWQHSRMQRSARVLMLALADHANDDGECWPSIARLAGMVAVNERNITRLIAQCEEAGELEVMRGAGRGQTNNYRILLPIKGVKVDRVNTEKGVNLEQKKVSTSAKKVSTLNRKGVKVDTQNHKEPSKNHKEEPSTPAFEIDHRLATIVAAYEASIGETSAYIAQSLSAFLEDHQVPAILEAIAIAARKGKKSPGYIGGILRNGVNTHVQGHSADAVFANVWRQIQRQRWELPRDGPEMAAIRQLGGWGLAKGLQEREKPFFKRQFVEAYNNAQRERTGTH